MFFFHKHNVYKHTEPVFWWKIKHMLSITPALIMKQIFSSDLNKHLLSITPALIMK